MVFMAHNGVVLEGLELEKLKADNEWQYDLIISHSKHNKDILCGTIYKRAPFGNTVIVWSGELIEFKNPRQIINSTEEIHHMSSEQLREKIEGKIVEFLNKPDLKAEDIKFLGEAWHALNQVDWLKELLEKNHGYDPSLSIDSSAVADICCKKEQEETT